MPSDSSPPAVWVNRTQPSPVSGSGRRSGRGTAAKPTNAAGSAPTGSPAPGPAAGGRPGAPTCPPPDWPLATTRPCSTSRYPSSRLARRTRPAASSASRSSRWVGGGSSYWAAPTWKWSRWPPSTLSAGTQDTAVTEDWIRTAATDATGWRPLCPASHPARSAEQLLEQLPDPLGAVDDQVGRLQQPGRGLGRADGDPQAAAELGRDGEGGQVAEVVAGDQQAAGARLADHPTDGVALVAVDLGAQLPDHPAGHDLQLVAGGDPGRGLADGGGPAVGVGDPAGVDGHGVALVLQVGAALLHGRVGGQVAGGGGHRRPGRLQPRVDQDAALDDLLQPVHAQVADPGGGGVAGQVGGRAAGDQGHGGVAVGQGAKKIDHPGQGPGGRRVVDDRGDGAVEVQADGHPLGLGGQPGDVGGRRVSAGPRVQGHRAGQPVSRATLRGWRSRARRRPPVRAHWVTRSRASATICLLILDTPEARSVKVIGTSATANPSCQALWTISTWKQ